MNYLSLSLKQDLIDKVFSKKNNGVQKEQNQTPSPGSISQKKYYKEQNELRLQNVVVDDCDQCDYKTTKFKALYRHKREKHTVIKQRCSDCEYSHIYPNRVKRHYNQVHMGMKRFIGRLDKCRNESCEFAGTTNCLELESHKLHKLKCRRESCENVGKTNCLELESHSLFFCNQCQLSFVRSDSLKYHSDKVHDGLLFKCDFCETYSTAMKKCLDRHILSKHSETDWKVSGKGKSCEEEK